MNEFSVSERVLLVVLGLLSVASFLWPLHRIVRAIIKARPEPNYQLSPLGGRVKDFVVEVLGQWKTIRDRKLAGLAHAFVFWGFLLFALITANHFGRALGFELILLASTWGQIYTGFVAVWSIFVLAAVVGLSVRRFILRPRWLGSFSWGSLLVNSLITVLMVTYLLEHYGPQLASLQKFNWWLHSLAVLLFLPVIPRTKHLHIIFAPVAVFLRRRQFGALLPLSGDEDVGIVTGKDVSRLMVIQAYACVECGRCTEHCPAFNTGKSLDPKEIVLGLRRYIDQFGVPSEKPILNTFISQQSVFECTTCGACEEHCPVGIQHLPILLGLRRGAVNTGQWQDRHATELFLSLERTGNVFGSPQLKREQFIGQLGLPIFDGSQDYCLWLGCLGSYDPRIQNQIRSLTRLLPRLNLSFGVLATELCCGDPVIRLGNDLLAEELIRQNGKTAQQVQVKRFLSICPHCVRTIRCDWPTYGCCFEVDHIAAVLDRHLPKMSWGSSAREFTDEFAVHDPCYLVRHLGEGSQLERVSSRFGKLRLPVLSGHRTMCCGAGGALVFLGEETGERTNLKRYRQLVETGATKVLVGCPFCTIMFEEARKDPRMQGQDRPVEIKHIVEIAEQQQEWL